MKLFYRRLANGEPEELSHFTGRVLAHGVTLYVGKDEDGAEITFQIRIVNDDGSAVE